MKVPKKATAALVLVFLVLLGGCSGFWSPSPPSDLPGNESGNEDTRIEVRNGSLSLNQTLVFERVQTVLDTDVEPPAYVRLVGDRENLTAGLSGNVSNSSFFYLMGLGDDDVSENPAVEKLRNQENGVTTALGAIKIYPGPGDVSEVERIVAHEYVHYIHFKNRRRNAVVNALNSRSTDSAFVVRALLEGTAVYATDAYIEKYLDIPRQSESVRELDDELPDGSLFKYSNFKYIYGYEYVSRNVGTPSKVSEIYESPPRTSEQMIHGYAPDEEPPANLTVDVEDEGSEWRYISKNTMGEAFVRIALENGVNESLAARGASGWGNDALRSFRREGEWSYAWVLRWDDEKNASRFVSVFEKYLDERFEKKNGAWIENATQYGFTRAGDETVVVLVGSEEFVGSVSVEGSDAEVGIEFGD